MTTVITLNVEPEPPEYHQLAPNTAAFGLHLSFDFVGTSQSAARQFFDQTIMYDIDKIRYVVYRFQNGPLKGPVNLGIAANIVLTFLRENPPDKQLRGALLDWMHSRTRTWATPATPSDNNVSLPEEANNGIVAAPHLLRSTAGWDSPVAHEMGLTFIAVASKTTIGDPEFSYVIVPFPVGVNPPGDIGGDRDGNLITIKLPNPDVHVQTTILTAFPNTIGRVDESGFLIADSDADLQYRLTRRFERDAAIALWTLPRLIEATNSVAVDPAWLAQAAAAAALDPIMIALLSPGLDDATEGHILSVLYSAYRVAAKGHPNELFSASVFVKAVKQLISGSDLLRAAPPDKAIPAIANALDLNKGAGDVLANTLFKDKIATIEELAPRLRKLAADVQEESGGEAAIVRLLRATLIGVAVQSPLAGALKTLSANADPALLEEFVRTAFATFESILKGDFNGAEAIRRTNGEVLLAALTQEVDTKKPAAAWKGVVEALCHSQYFEQRLSSGQAVDNAVAKVQSALWRPAEKIPAELSIQLDLRLKAYVNELFLGFGVDFNAAGLVIAGQALPAQRQRRFLPDHAPQPLPIRIADTTTNASELEQLNHTFNGIGVLIADEAKPKTYVWSHASLAKLAHRADFQRPIADDYTVPIVDATVHPFTPALINGQRQLFITYDGFPLASPAFDNTNRPVGEAGDKNSQPFYRLDDLDTVDDAALTPPPLAYGKTFKSCAFVTSKAGSLPKAFQAAPARPWAFGYAKAFDPDPHFEARFVVTAPYKRRTAIGRVEMQNPAEDRRIDATYENVHPLSKDYPRTAVSASRGNAGVVDVLRNSDGTGGILIGAAGTPGGETVVDITDVMVAGTGGALSFASPFDAEESAAGTGLSPAGPSLNLPANTDGLSIQITIKQVDKGKDVVVVEKPFSASNSRAEVRIDVRNGVNVARWLQLWLTVDGATNVGISFASIEGDTRAARYSAAKSAPLLVIAPDDKATWKSAFSREFKAHLDLSRVSYLDLERWIANPLLFNSLLPDPDNRARLASALLRIYALRGLTDSFAKRIDRLPDPAVVGYLLELTPMDAITDGTPKLDPVRKFVVFNAYDRAKGSAPPLPKPNDRLDLQRYEEFLGKLCGALEGSVAITCGALKLDEAFPKLTVSVPSGVTAQLTICPVVDADSVGKAIDGQMSQLAVGSWVSDKGAFMVFEGAALRIEGMSVHPGWFVPASASGQPKRLPEIASLSREGIRTVAHASARSFDLVAHPPRKDNGLPSWNSKQMSMWRHIAHIESETQAWRHSGRPIYNWIKPRSFAITLKGAPPTEDDIVLELEERNGGTALGRFEAEIYFDRDDKDADPRPQRLGPNGLDTVLRTFHLSLKADYFRYRFAFRSRYSGAMRTDARGQRAQDTQPGVWTKRVAVLADAKSAKMTRPQLRGIVPLAAKPDIDARESPAATPPLACIMEEKPFAVGGLSDRIVAEIATTTGYRFTQVLGENVLQASDLRRGIGTDARLSLSPLAEDDALAATASIEGPVGLTFDRTSAGTGAWVNSQLLLKPILGASTPAGQETFLGVKLLRYLDPNWTAGKNVYPERPVTLTSSWWIEFADTGSIVLPGNEIVCRINEKNGEWRTVEIGARWIDPTITSGAFLKLCRVEGSGPIVLAHIAADDGQYTLAVLASNTDMSASERVRLGLSSAPNLLASVEWKPPLPNPGAALPKREFTAENAKLIWPLVCSTATTLEWARTARDGDTLLNQRIPAVKDPAGMPALVAQRPDQLLVQISANATNPKLMSASFIESLDAFRFTSNSIKRAWLLPRQDEHDHPRSVHRHLAAIFTTTSEGFGRKIDVFCCMQMITSAEFEFMADGSADISGVRIAEFQLPARPLALYASAAVPRHYLQLYIDAKALKAEESQNYRLHVRLVTLRTGKANFAKFSMKIGALVQAQPGDAAAWTDAPFDLVPEKDFEVRAFDLVVSRAGKKRGVFVRWYDWYGHCTPWVRVGDIAASWDNKAIITGFRLSGVASPVSAANGELWTDVSMLPSDRAFNMTAADDAFDFDWIFTGARDEAPEKGTEATAAVLGQNYEAAAQIIAWSSPIGVAP